MEIMEKEEEFELGQACDASDPSCEACQ